MNDIGQQMKDSTQLGATTHCNASTLCVNTNAMLLSSPDPLFALHVLSETITMFDKKQKLVL